MKKIFFIILVLLFPSDGFTQLDVFLSSQNLPYGKDVWTSANYPDSGSSGIKIKRNHYREEFPPEYQMNKEEIKDLIYGLFPTLSSGEKQVLYNSLMAFEKLELSQYIGISLWPDTQSIIFDKQSRGQTLTPFESTFQNCAIDLASRESIAVDLIINIDNGTYTDIDSLEYNDIRFGDCIIPFPDIRRGINVITDSFPSNKIIAESVGGNSLRFGTLEDTVNLFSLSDVILDGSYVGVQENNLLNLQSTRVEQDTIIEKQFGKSKILYIHQNHLKNIYKDIIISGDTTLGYTLGGDLYDINHPLFIQSSDSEIKRTLSGWQVLQEGIYTKTLIQENTFESVGGVYVPNQNIGVTTYYAIIYNYDTTAPQCPATLFSHENTGNENFTFPEYPWFGDSKYGYFFCSDEESGCSCDSSSVGCFLKDNAILSTPQEISHSDVFQYRFWNGVGLSSVCSSPIEKKIYYDKISPDVHIALPGIPEASLEREYVDNAGILYDGRELVGKKFYQITNELSFPADNTLNIQLELYDPYDNTKLKEGVSGLHSYSLNISRFENDNWITKSQQDYIFENYNPLATKNFQDTYVIDFQTLENIDSIITQIGKYQVYLDFDDAAGNQSRVILYFDIVSGDIDVVNSILEVLHRNTIYANNNDNYSYALLLKDEYFNPVSGKSISSVEHSCISISVCRELRLDMTGATPMGDQALDIYDIDPISDVNGAVYFSVSSRVPGIFTESFTVNIGDPGLSLRFLAGNNTFLAPIIGTLEVMVSSFWVSNKLPIGSQEQYRIRIQDINSLGYTWSLSDFSSYIRARHPDTDFTLSGPLVTGADGAYFSGTFTSTLSEGEKHKTLLEITENSLSGIIISYLIDGEEIKYLLSSESQFADVLQLGNTGELENPVKIIGNLQGVGNTHNLLERQNRTDLAPYVFRNIIRKNVGTNINIIQNDTTIGGVKYIDKTLDSNKNYILESNPVFETLIVRNGNILIQNDFNIAGKVIGLISYIDSGYNKMNGFEEIGNIYVEPEVTSITAFMYADGGLISTQFGSPISGNIYTRNDSLKNQLLISGSLFTRNTLAGARQLDGSYMLPGGEITIQHSLATQYDLYHIRRGNEQCIRDTYGFCNTPEYLIIEYDPRVISSPPTFFDMQ